MMEDEQNNNNDVKEMAYKSVYNRLRIQDISPLAQPLGFCNMQRFQEEGGNVLAESLNDYEFLKKYFVVIEDKVRIKYEWKDTFARVREFVSDFKCRGDVPASFFYFKYIKILYNVKDEDERKAIEEVIIPKKIIKEEDDFLGFEGNFKIKKISEISDAYFNRIRSTYTKQEIMIKYRAWLQYVSIPSLVNDIVYDNPYEFVHTSEKQFGYYYEVMKKFKEENEGRKVFIPCDGLGYMSMICETLNIDYYSYEIYDVGKIAYKLGIITSNKVEDIVFDKEDRVNVICNLSSYLQISRYTHRDYIVIDENRLYEDIKAEDIKRTSQCRVTSNVLSDSFFGVNNIAGKSMGILEDKFCIPLNSKAEAFLISNGKKAYTDGKVKTILPSEVIVNVDKRMVRYITTTDFEKITDVTGYYLNIMNRNYINGDKGKAGEYKYKDGGYYLFTGVESELLYEDGYERVKNFFYSHAAQLNSWYRRGNFFITHEKGGARKRYLIENGQKRFIMYLHGYYSPQYGNVSIYCEKGENFYLRKEIYKIKED